MSTKFTERELKKRLIKNLKEGICCRVGVSTFLPNQVGVIATRDIPKGVDPFQIPDEDWNGKVISLTHQDLNSLDSTTRDMVNDFYHPDETGLYPVNANGLNALDVSFYLNHSDTPNIKVYHAPGEYYRFKTKRPIRKGEELTYRYFNINF